MSTTSTEANDPSCLMPPGQGIKRAVASLFHFIWLKDTVCLSRDLLSLSLPERTVILPPSKGQYRNEIGHFHRRTARPFKNLTVGTTMRDSLYLAIVKRIKTGASASFSSTWKLNESNKREEEWYLTLFYRKISVHLTMLSMVEIHTASALEHSCIHIVNEVDAQRKQRNPFECRM